MPNPAIAREKHKEYNRIVVYEGVENMNSYIPMIIFLIILSAAFLLVFLSFTPWAHENIKWITSLKFYVFVGILFGLSMLYLCYLLIIKLIPLYT
jgi:hypothetical protein